MIKLSKLMVKLVVFEILWIINEYVFECLLFRNFVFETAVNRRLDEWIQLEQLDLDSVECVVDEKVEEKVVLLIFM